MAISPADTAFMLACGALVNLMTPGLALFYGGLVRHHNTVVMISQNFVTMGLVTVLWFLVVFSLCFAESWDPYGFIGNPFTFAGFSNVSVQGPLAYGESAGRDAKIPGLCFAFYQCMFAIITPNLMTGAFADRLRYKPWILFMVLWTFLVYAPWCHMIWGGGYMAQQGVADFAGGIVVHVTAGFSCLAVILVLGKRERGWDQGDLDAPHSIPLVFLGTGLLWFGWFGFNGGSASAANSTAVGACWNSQLAAASAMISWVIMEQLFRGKPGLVGKCCGVIAGLATITPAAGFVQPSAAFLLGIVAGPVCYSCIHFSKWCGFDDALDVWGVHGMGSFVGVSLLGLLADGPECGDVASAPDYCMNPGTVTRSLGQFKIQLAAACCCALYSFGMSYMILRVLQCFFSLHYTAEEQRALDDTEHGETAYYAGPVRDGGARQPLLKTEK